MLRLNRKQEKEKAEYAKAIRQKFEELKKRVDNYNNAVAVLEMALVELNEIIENADDLRGVSMKPKAITSRIVPRGGRKVMGDSFTHTGWTCGPPVWKRCVLTSPIS